MKTLQPLNSTLLRGCHSTVNTLLRELSENFPMASLNRGSLQLAVGCPEVIMGVQLRKDSLGNINSDFVWDEYWRRYAEIIPLEWAAQSISVFDLSNGSLKRVLIPASGSVRRSPEGKYEAQKVLFGRDANGRKYPLAGFSAVAFKPDGVAVAGYSHTLQQLCIWNLTLSFTQKLVAKGAGMGVGAEVTLYPSQQIMVETESLPHPPAGIISRAHSGSFVLAEFNLEWGRQNVITLYHQGHVLKSFSP